MIYFKHFQPYNIKKEALISQGFFSAAGGTRTHTISLPPDFESGASAIPPHPLISAFSSRNLCYHTFFEITIVFFKKHIFKPDLKQPFDYNANKRLSIFVRSSSEILYTLSFSSTVTFNSSSAPYCGSSARAANNSYILLSSI